MIFPSPKDFQSYKVCAAYIRQLPSGIPIDPISVAFMMQNDWEIRLDWHEFSYALDNLTRDANPSVRLIGHDSNGMSQYRTL